MTENSNITTQTNFGDLTHFSMSELFDVVLVTNEPVTIGDQYFESGEVLAAFDSIFISIAREVKDRSAATGGFRNKAQVLWEDVREVHFDFSQGVFSLGQLALLSNSNILNLNANNNFVCINEKEELETNDDGHFTLKHKPCQNMFVYDAESGNKLSYTQINDTTFKIATSYTNIIVRYEWDYQNGANVLVSGQRLLPGFLSLRGKTILKDTEQGREVTGLVSIPKLKIVSDLNIQLGTQASPNIASFNAVGYPTGPRHEEEVYSIYVLNDNLRADF